MTDKFTCSLESTKRLAYSHENGIVLVDIIQKCTIMNASLNDLYGGASAMANQRDIVSIQPFDTSSILQQHYQSGAASAAATTAALAGPSTGNISAGPTFARIKNQPGEGNHNNGVADHLSKLTRGVGQSDDSVDSNDNGNGASSTLSPQSHKSNPTQELGLAHSEVSRLCSLQFYLFHLFFATVSQVSRNQRRRPRKRRRLYLCMI